MSSKKIASRSRAVFLTRISYVNNFVPHVRTLRVDFFPPTNIASFDFQEASGAGQFNQRERKKLQMRNSRMDQQEMFKCLSRVLIETPGIWVLPRRGTMDQRINLKAAVHGMWYACLCALRVCIHVCTYIIVTKNNFALLRAPGS